MKPVKKLAVHSLVALFIVGCATAQPIEAANVSGPCKSETVNDADYVVCRFAGDVDIRLFLNNAAGEPYKHFNWVNDALAEDGKRLVFAMNAGMYHEDRSPVGLFIEVGEAISHTNNNDGPGNFHLKPNGVFFVSAGGQPQVVATEVFVQIKQAPPKYATQSGPMLVIDGELHPKFLADSTSRKRRNGVGVDESGDVWFVLADTPVTFHEFGSYFRDVLKTPNALYLDGTISRLYAPELERNDPGLAMGPIVGVVAQQN
ncbi:MAG: hypothetical protein HKN14_01800 [Marinicaulis sp.]|nr:hypothetical protein [Marinicaulis sp.]